MKFDLKIADIVKNGVQKINGEILYVSIIRKNNNYNILRISWCYNWWINDRKFSFVTINYAK